MVKSKLDMDEQTTEATLPEKPSTSSFKQVLVGFAVGICFGQMLGVLGGVCGAPVGVFVAQILGISSSSYVGFRATALAGSLVGALLGIPTGVCVGIIVRIYSTIVRESPLDSNNAAFSGVVIAYVCGAFILLVWNPPYEMWTMMGIHSLIVGWGTGYIAALAKPKWASQ
jgi:hypothetical protein